MDKQQSSCKITQSADQRKITGRQNPADRGAFTLAAMNVKMCTACTLLILICYSLSSSAMLSEPAVQAPAQSAPQRPLLPMFLRSLDRRPGCCARLSSCCRMAFHRPSIRT